MVQCNKEGGEPFNFTAIVLVKKDATGITAKHVDGDDNMSGSTYNLAGQRVAQPQQGLYIQNGKKFIIK